MITIVLLLALASFGAFGLASDGHFQRVVGRRASASTKLRCRIAAWLGLMMSAAASIKIQGFGLGLVSWFGFIMLAAGTVSVALNFFVTKQHRE